MKLKKIQKLLLDNHYLAAKRPNHKYYATSINGIMVWVKEDMNIVEEWKNGYTGMALIDLTADDWELYYINSGRMDKLVHKSAEESKAELKSEDSGFPESFEEFKKKIESGWSPIEDIIKAMKRSNHGN